MYIKLAKIKHGEVKFWWFAAYVIYVNEWSYLIEHYKHVNNMYSFDASSIKRDQRVSNKGTDTS